MARLSASEKQAVRAALRYVLHNPEHRQEFSDKQINKMEAATLKYNMPPVEQKQAEPQLYEVIGHKLNLDARLTEQLKEVLALTGATATV